MSEAKITELKHRLREYAVGHNDYSSLASLTEIVAAANSECSDAEDRVRCLQQIVYEARQLMEDQETGSDRNR